MRHRSTKKGIMQLALRAWREQVEHTNATVASDPSRWRVRTQPTRDQPRASTIIGPIKHTDAKILAVNRKEDWSDINPRYRIWSPWIVREPTTKIGATQSQQQHVKRTKTLSDEEKRWKLRDKCLRVATYYRLMGMRSRSEHRTRLGASKKTFRTWANSVIEQRRESKRIAAHEREAERQRFH